MRTIATIAIAVLTFYHDVVRAQMPGYEPLGKRQYSASRAWERHGPGLCRVEGVRALPTGARPEPAGLRHRGLEMLQDAIRRKHPRLLAGLGTTAERELLLNRFHKNPGPLRGMMAEAVFIDRNPEWGYVKNPIAPQHDVFRFLSREGPPMTGQVKFHMDFDAWQYLEDMKNDWAAHRFIVPDDHVRPLREVLERKALQAVGRGDPLEAQYFRQQKARVTPLGAATEEIDFLMRDSLGAAAREHHAAYVTLGSAAALSLGPALWELASGHARPDQAVRRTSRTLSITATGLLVDVGLGTFANGAIRGTVKGNVITGTAISLAETGWLIYEHGGSEAFSRPEFYLDLGGTMGAVSMGMLGGSVGMAMFAWTGPWAPPIGLICGGVSGAIGYVGGREATRIMLHALAPDMIRKHEREYLISTKTSIEENIRALRGDAIRRE